MLRLIGVLAVLAMAWSGAGAQGLLGVWQEPEGARIEVHPCGAYLCLRLIRLTDHPAGTVDGHNPDKSLRTRPLLGMEVGLKFHPTDANHADDGLIYDPKSGKTYHSTLESVGDELRLRGYVGIKAFGRTETWTRVK